MNSLIKDTARPSLVKRNIPPLYKDLLIWTNREYDSSTHQIKSRISDYHITLKQGLVAEASSGAYLIVPNGAISGIAGSDWSMAFCINSTTAGIWQQILGAFDTTGGTKRFYITINNGTLTYHIGTGTAVTVSTSGFLVDGTSYIIMLSHSNSTGVITSKVKNMATGVVTNLTNYTVAGLTELNDNGLGVFDNANGAANTFLGKLWNLRIWLSQQSFDNMGNCNYGTGCNLFLPLCGTLKDISGNNYHAVNAGSPAVALNSRDNYASYYCTEHGFAVKDGDIYPKNYAGTGYAGLVGDPDAVYQGLIATKGQPEIGTKQYLGTEYDFGDAEAITDAGISWDEWDGEDTNLDTVGTAETDLDTDYYNAIVASLMTNTSIAGYAGTSNVSKRLFFKVADRVMKDDGSFLAESGRVQEILVYKRDLSASEILRVQKYCREVTE